MSGSKLHRDTELLFEAKAAAFEIMRQSALYRDRIEKEVNKFTITGDKYA